MSKEFVSKIVYVQNGLKAPKNQYNSFGGYAYRSCEDILEAVKPLLATQNLCLMVSDEIIQLGNRYYIKATASLTDGEEVVQNVAYAREAESKTKMDDSQITGAASSYARKYALNGLFCIDDVKDADATNTHGKDEKSPSEKAKETREKNKEIADKLRAEAKGCMTWLAKQKDDISKEDRIKVEDLINRLQNSGLIDEAGQIAVEYKKFDKIGF